MAGATRTAERSREKKRGKGGASVTGKGPLKKLLHFKKRGGCDFKKGKKRKNRTNRPPTIKKKGGRQRGNFGGGGPNWGVLGERKKKKAGNTAILGTNVERGEWPSRR